MRNGTILAILTCASALSIVTEIPCAHAQEYVTYLYYQPGSGGNRINHTGTPARFVTLAGPTQESVMLTPGAIVPVPTGAPSTWTVGSIKYGLAYVNVTGGAGGGISIFPDANGNFPQAVNDLHLLEEAFLTISMRDILSFQLRGFWVNPPIIDRDSVTLTALPDHLNKPLNGKR